MSVSRGSQRRPRVALTLGKFDGVHAGHRHLAAQTLAAATRHDAEAAALVLHPHPASVLFGARIPLLGTVHRRCAQLRDLGLGIVEPLQFTREIAGLTPDAFIERVTQRFQVSAIVVGPDFAFGQARQGDTETLRDIGRRRGFELVVVPDLEVDGRRVSSGAIRGLVEAGDLVAARQLLREPPCLTGTVVHGAARGRELGFPTANLDLRDDFVVPGNGIYAVRARWDGAPARDGSGWVDGVASIGVRPTFDNGPRSIEVFLLDFAGDLYGRRLDLAFIARQRGEERFDSVGALVAQMHVDVARSRQILAAETKPAWRILRQEAGPQAELRGFDLADLCQSAAASLAALRAGQVESAPPAAWAGRPGPAGRPEGTSRPLSVQALPAADSAAAEAELLRAWLASLGPAQDARVFQAGAGRVQGLVIGPAAGGSPPELVSGPERGADGWLQASLRLTAVKA